MANQTGSKAEGKQQVHQLFKGIVKNVLSGDSVFIRSVNKKDGKYLEKQVMLSHILAPRVGRRLQDGTIEPDQPYAFEAREFLRTKLIGKEVCFIQEGKTTTNNIDVGVLYLGKDLNGENVIESIIDAGLATVKEKTKYNEDETKLLAIQEQAKAQGKGLWSTTSPASEHVRDVKYSIDNPTNFVDSFHYKPINAIVEYVKDGSTLRVLLLPSHHLVTIQLSGLKAPGVKRGEKDDKDIVEPYFEDAKFFVESRLLQREVKVILEGVVNQVNGILLGTILHPNGNISEFLLKEGLARCIDWSMGYVTQGSDKYRLAEKQAKQAKSNLWKNYQPAAASGDDGPKTFTGKVVEISNGEGLVVKTQEGVFKKIFLSSIRQPRIADFNKENGGAAIAARPDKKNVPLYDVPYLFEAREFLRKKLIGKKVTCTIDYVQPKSEDYPEKTCCTVIFGEINVAEALVSNGLAKVIRYKQNDDQRSSKYDELLGAETRAEKKEVGIHSKKEKAPLKIADASSDEKKAKQFLPSLQRLDNIEALVEFVASGSRFRLYLAKESCLLTFLLSGIECPRLGRAQGPNNATATKDDEYAQEALSFTRERCMQHEVRIEIETVDKGGNFIGWLFLPDGTNLSVALVQAGYAAVHKTAERSSYYNVLTSAEKVAKEKRLNRWKNYVEEKPVVEEVEDNEPHERGTQHPTKVVVTEVREDLHFYAQTTENATKLEQLTTQLRSELDLKPPVAGSYTAKAGELCVAKFSADDEWYRAKVQKVDSKGVLVQFIDYGNQEYVQATKVAQLPSGFSALPAQATEYALALVQLPKDSEDVEAAVEHFKSEVQSDTEFSITKEYRNGTLECVKLTDTNKTDIGKSMIANGYVLCERRREKRLHALVSEYQKAQEQAKAARRNLWKYGDITEDDANEFGFQSK